MSCLMSSVVITSQNDETLNTYKQLTFNTHMPISLVTCKETGRSQFLCAAKPEMTLENSLLLCFGINLSGLTVALFTICIPYEKELTVNYSLFSVVCQPSPKKRPHHSVRKCRFQIHVAAVTSSHSPSR